MREQQENRIVAYLRALGRDTILTSWVLIKITVPVIIITKILEEYGLISIVSSLLSPLMNLIGLPGELGLVWGTAMLTTLYGGLAVFAALAPALDLSIAQVTILCSAMLIAHSLPIELTISKKSGVPLTPILLLRVVGALCYCCILDRLCSGLSVWQQPAALLFAPPADKLSLGAWAMQQCINIGLIIFIIFCILIIMRVLRLVGVLGILERILTPVLPIFGMSGKMAPVTVVGMVMGIGYGGALIIREIAEGKMSRAEVFNSMAMMGLCHGLVEDTLIMVAMGGRLGGILWGRIVFSLVVTYLLVRLLRALPGRVTTGTA
jgi:spore maturation protein SpmB